MAAHKFVRLTRGRGHPSAKAGPAAPPPPHCGASWRTTKNGRAQAGQRLQVRQHTMHRATQVFDIQVRVDLRRELRIAVPEQPLDLDEPHAASREA